MKSIFPVLLIFASILASAQVDTAGKAGAFQKIMAEVQSYKIDTTAVPEERITRKIRQLRYLKGGFNINEAIAFKMDEDEAKKEMPAETIEKLRKEFTSGRAKQLLDNATTWIYRQHFDYKELKQLVKFYKTSAGQKLATDFPVIMLKSLMAAQLIKDQVVK